MYFTTICSVLLLVCMLALVHAANLALTRHNDCLYEGVINATFPLSEFSALNDLYESTSGDNWKWDNDLPGVPWNFTNNNPCADQWQGITCTSVFPDGSIHLSKLELSNHELNGALPGTIANLTFMTVLDLSSNNLNCTIPSSLGSLSQLQDINLGLNPINGRIPASFGKLSALTSLSIYTTSIGGPLPPNLAALTQLVYLELYENNLSGTVPTYLCNMPNLTDLALNDNLLHGPLPSCLCDLQHLAVFQFSLNQLTGVLPESMGQLTKVKNLWLNDNKFTGTIPPSVSNMFAMTQFYVSTNYLTGQLPPDCSQWTNLLIFAAKYNSFTGPVPASLSSATQLLDIFLDHNYLQSTVPASLGNLTQLYSVYLRYNLLTGTLPTSFVNLRSLNALFLESNYLSGNLQNAFQPSSQVNLNIVQISYNQFTGELPLNVLLLPALNTFVAVGNCFSGTLPQEICRNTRLESLILDGVHTATACRKKLIPRVSHSYYVPKNLEGTVPACFFSMPNLTSLHISGNGFTGQLPDLHNISDKLVDLTLSNNKLTGPIPAAFQTIDWQFLDLSYNRFVGELEHNFGTEPRDLSTFLTIQDSSLGTKLQLQNNRLSGHVPHTMKNLHNITVLGTNMFECELDKSDLPEHDPYKSRYDCASDNFTIPFYVWLVLFFTVCVCSAVAYWKLAENFPSIVKVIEKARRWTTQGDALPRNYKFVDAISDILCKISVWCTSAILLIMVPWYETAGYFYGTYFHQYAYAVSAAFLAGPVVAGVEIVLFLGFQLLMVGSLAYLILQYDQQSSRNRVHSRPDSARLSKTEPVVRPPLRRRFAVYTAFLLINLFAVAGINVAFVYIALNESNTVLVFAQVFLSLFMLLWNSVCAPLLIRYIANHMSRAIHDTDFVTIQVVIALINNIAIPCLIVAVVSPSCFYSVFSAPAPIDSVFVYTACVNVGQDSVCIEEGSLVQTTSYDPPFVYSYQCSSGFVTYYAPSFIYLGIAAGFGAPLAKWAGKVLHERAEPGTVWHWLLTLTVPPVLRTIAHIYNNRLSNLTKDSVGGNTVDSAISYDELRRNVYSPYFDANIYIISLLTYLGILMTFGVVFPPLALTMSVTMLSVSWQAKLAVGRFLYQARTLDAHKFVDIIDEECKGTITLKKIKRSVMIIICFSCTFYALFLFDTLGDRNDLKHAYWVLIFMPLTPFLFAAIVSLFRKWRGALDLDFHLDRAASADHSTLGLSMVTRPSLRAAPSLSPDLHSHSPGSRSMSASRAASVNSALTNDSGSFGTSSGGGLDDRNATFNALLNV